MGASTLVGWLAGIRRLTDWQGRGITMFANTALAAGLAGGALLLVAGGRHRAIIAVLALVVALIGGATLLEHITGADLGIDTLLVRDVSANPVAAAPGRMGPPASASFLLIGTAVLLLTRGGRRGRSLAAGLGTITMAIGLLSLIGYAYGATMMYSLPRLTGIAMQSATVVFALGLAVVIAIPDRHPMQTILADGTAGILARRLLPLVIVVPVVIGWLRVQGQAAGLYDPAFGTALRTLVEVALLWVMLWWATRVIAARERALRASEERVRSVLENSLDAAYRRDLRTDTYDYLSPVIEQVMGISAEQLRVMSAGAVTERIHPDDLGRVQQAIEQGMRSGKGRVEYRLRTGDGQYRWMADHFTVHADADGTPLFRSGIIRDVTEQKLAEQSLRESERQHRELADALGAERAKLAAVIETLPVGVGMSDPDGRILSLNRAGLALHGFASEAEMLDRLDRYTEEFELLHLDGRVMPIEQWPISRAMRGEYVQDCELRLRKRACGTEHVVSYGVAPVRNSRDEVAVLVYVIQDLTEQTRSQDAIVRARDAAEAASKAKDHFLAVVSHELRTPLNPILTLATYLQGRDDLPADLRDDMVTIRRNVEQEARIVDDLLSLTRLNRGKVQLHHEVVDLHALVRIAVAQFAEQANTKRIDLRSSLDANAFHVWADAGRMQQVLSNLLDNALKFTPERGRVTVRSWNTPDGLLSVAVEDSGAGIDPAVLPILFSPFEQGERTITRRYGGLGLGLAIAKGIMDLHGGTISAFSDGRGRGARFTLQLQGMRTPSRSEVPSEAPPSDPVGPQSRILLVEDHPDTLKVMSRLLKNLGYTVITAQCVSEAMEKVEHEQFDLLVSDIGLPDGSGLDIMRSVRRRHLAKGIALSGFGHDEDIRRSRDAGFEEHLVKPVNLQLLDSTIKRLSC